MKSEKISVHHIKPESCGGDFELSNLTTLCTKCHRWVHANSKGNNPGKSEKARMFLKELRDKVRNEERIVRNSKTAKERILRQRGSSKRKKKKSKRKRR